jgi:signal transduction histidine kinase
VDRLSASSREAFSRCVGDIAATPSWELAVDKICEALQIACGCDAVLVIALDSWPTTHSAPPGLETAARWRKTVAPLLTSAKPQWWSEPPADLIGAAAGPFPCAAAALVPLWDANHIFAQVCLVWHTAPSVAPDLDQFAVLAAQITDAWHHRVISLRADLWARVHGLITTLVRGTDAHTLLPEAARLALEMLAGDLTCIWIYDETSKDLVLRTTYAADELEKPALGERLRVEPGYLAQATVPGGQTMSDGSIPGCVLLPSSISSDEMAALSVPMRCGSRFIGLLTVLADKSRRFSHDEQTLLQTFADQMATMLEMLRERAAGQAQALNAERLRLANDLHDGLAQDLAGLLLRTEQCRYLAERVDPSLADQLESICTGLQHGIQETRAMVFGLRAVALNNNDLVPALRELIAGFESAAGVPVTFSVAGQRLEQMSLSHKLALLRLVQEGLSNVRAHARASWVHVLLEGRGRRVRLQIEDNGRGFDPTAAPAARSVAHLGLTSMRERVEALSGQFVVDSQPGTGTRLCVVLPLEEESTRGQVEINDCR